MLDFSIYLLYRAASFVVVLIPLRLLFHIGELLGLLAWFFLGSYRRLARRNLAIAFGTEKSPAELQRLALRHFQRLGANLLCSVKTSVMPAEEVAALVRPENFELAHEEVRAGHPVVLVLSHLSNWEIIAPLLPLHFGQVRNSTLYQKLRNPYIDADVRRKRERSGVELFDRSEGFRGPIALLREAGGIGILSDQHAGDHGIWTPFFGRLASTSPLAGLLAKRTGATVMSAAVFTEGPARWRMVFTPRLDGPGDSVEAITAKANRVMEDQIRRAPEDWFWVHNRWKTPQPNFLLAGYKRGVYLPRQIPAAALQPFRILIRGTNWLGDSVISAAAVRAIKHGRPDARVSVAAPARLAAVWKLIPEVDEVIELPAGSLFAVARRLKRQPQFDVAVLFPNSLRTALEVWIARIPRRVGYCGHQRSWLLNQIVPELSRQGPIRHQADRYLHIAQVLGTIPPHPTTPLAPAPKASGPVKLGLCPGAEYGPAKRWLPERFAEVAAAVAAQKPAQWHLFGTGGDEAIGQRIAEQLRERCVNRIGKTSLQDLIAELRGCRLLLTNDTGTMHLATLLGVPVVAIFGSTEQRLTGPLGGANVVIRHHVECSPCFLRECPLDFRCMKAVTSEEVTAAVLSALDIPVAFGAQPA